MANIETISVNQNGTADADIIVVVEFSGSDQGNTVNAGDGDDIVYGDHDSVHVDASTGNVSIATAVNIDDAATWSTKANPDVFDDTVPYTTVLGTGVGELDFFAVTVGAGQTITLDLDYGAGTLGGGDVDYVIRLFDALGNELAMNDDSSNSNGGLGSGLSLDGNARDPFVNFTVVDGGTYYIQVEQYFEAPIETGNVYLLNVSVTGHANTNIADFDADTLSGEGGNDTLHGGDFGDTLYGGADSDRLYGGAGNDVLLDEADGADDMFVGGADEDAYIIYSGGGLTTIVEDALTSNNNGIQALYSVDGWTINGATGTGSSVGASVTFDPNAISYLYGSGQGDTLTARAAGQTLIGFGGADTLIGGAGADTLDGGEGDDMITGGAGIDVLDHFFSGAGVTVSLAITAAQNTGAGVDTISGVENLRGSMFGDVLTGSSGKNSIYGYDGNDVIEGLGSADVLDGQGGDHDTASYEHATGRVIVSLALQGGAQNTLGGGVDTLTGFEDLRGSAYGDTLTGDGGFNEIAGLGGKDIIDGGAGDDTLDGGAGDDVLTGGANDDILDGGADFDIVSYAGAGAGVVVNIGIVGVYTSTFGAGDDAYLNIEGIIGSAFTDLLIGTAGDNSIAAGNGADTIAGDAGNDKIDGGAGTDVLDYSYGALAGGVTVSLAVTFAQNTVNGGNDSITGIENLVGTQFADTLTGSTAQNFLYGVGGNDVLSGGLGNDTLDGGSDVDTVTFANAASAVRVRLNVAGSQNTLAEGNDTFISIENVTGSAFNDELTGSDGDNVLTGGNGNDLFIGGLGNDTLVGGAGTDTASYAGNAVGVTVSLASVVQQNTVGAGLDTLSAIENLTGTSFNDILTGSTGSNVILGGNGLDTIDGGGGIDTIDGGAGNDTLTGGAADDVLTGGTGNDTLDGGTQNDTASYAGATGGVTVSLAVAGAQAVGGGQGSDTLISIERLVGSGLADTLTGSSGINTITGGAGKDTMAGGGNNDRFVFLSTADSVVGANADRITDLSSGDIVDLSAIDAHIFAGGDQPFIQVGAFSGFAGQFTLIYDGGTNTTTFSGDVTGDMIADMQILFTGDVTGMTGTWVL